MKCFLISILYFTFFYSFSSTCKALGVDNYVNSRANSMGNVLSVLPGFTNPSSNGFAELRYFSLQYTNRYGIKELSTFGGMVDFPNKYLNLGLYVSRYGFDTYHETNLALNFYKRLSDYISLGVRVNYLNLHYSDQESNKSTVTGDIGLLTCPLENFYVGILAVNPLRTHMSIAGKKIELPTTLAIGLSYKIEKIFLLTAEVDKDYVFPMVWKFGFEYTPVEQFSIRAGIYGKPFTPCFGVGVNIVPFSIDISFNRHPVLGFYSCCALRFIF